MPIAIRRRRDTVPSLSQIAALDVRSTSDIDLLQRLTGRTEDELRRRLEAGHRAYVAWYDGVPAAFGWVATQAAEIGEVHASFRIEPRERYLWNFVTLASHRGLGIYPRLLDAIVRSESEAELFWIAYAPENRASGSGIAKAGFMTVAELSFDEDSRPAVRMAEGSGIAGDSVFGLPVVTSDLAPCWKCIRAGRVGMSCKDGACHCDYQRPTVTCAA